MIENKNITLYYIPSINEITKKIIKSLKRAYLRNFIHYIICTILRMSWEQNN